LDGQAPKDLAPNVFKIARFKNRSVHTELHNLNWIRNLQEISNVVQLEEFTILFMALSSIELTQESDKIYWKWTVDGKFTVAYAYDCQFWWAMSTFSPNDVWKATTKPKCRFFSWLVMHDRVLTADNMAAKNWPCNPICSLCYCLPEITSHLLTQYNFTEASWNIIASHFSLPQCSVLASMGGPKKWMQQIKSKGYHN
jgi:hypothetical protein